MNHVILCGRLGRDPEVKFTGNGKAMCLLSVATDDTYTDASGARQQRTDWHKVVVWGKPAEACGQYLAKGRQVLVDGALRTRTYEHNGTKRTSIEIVADRVEFLGGGKDLPRERAPVSTAAAGAEIPF
jgi:single-strand DNA-binding protein